MRIDDPHYVSDNAVVQRGLTIEGVRWAFTTMHASNWHPLTWLSHMLDCELFGSDPGAHHATNAVLHVASGLLAWLAFARLTGKPWRSWFVALLFLVHPLHVESVAWISERKDVLSAFFFMLVLLAYERYARAPAARRMVWVTLWLALGLMSKPMLVTTPFVLVLLDVWPLGRKLSWARFVEKWPLFVLSVASSIATFVAQHDWGSVASLDSWPLWKRVVDAVIAYAEYLRMALWPRALGVHYPHVLEARWGALAIASLVLVAITLVAVRERPRRPWLVVAWSWYLGTLAPVIGIVQVGSQSMADRYTYLPLMGAFLAVVWFAAETIESSNLHRAIAFGGAIVVGVPLALLAHRQAGVWHDSLTLFEHAVRVQPRSAAAHQSLGDELVERGQLDEGIAHLRTALAIDSGSEMAHNGLGVALDASGDKEAGIVELRRATEIAPNYFEAWFNLGISLHESADLEGAATAFERAVALRAWHFEARMNLALTLMQLGRLELARDACQAAARLGAASVDDHRRLAAVAEAVGERSLALSEYRAIVAFDAHDEAACERALALATELKDNASAAEFSAKLERIRRDTAPRSRK